MNKKEVLDMGNYLESFGGGSEAAVLFLILILLVLSTMGGFW